MFEFLWNNGLIRAALALFIVTETLLQEVVTGVAPNDTHWTIAVAVGAWYFGTGSVKPVVGAIKAKLP